MDSHDSGLRGDPGAPRTPIDGTRDPHASPASYDLRTLEYIHNEWEFADMTEPEFDEFLHRLIQDARRASALPSEIDPQVEIDRLRRELAIMKLAVPIEDEIHDRMDTTLKYLAMQQGFTLTEIALLLIDCQRRMAADWLEIGQARREAKAALAAADPALRTLSQQWREQAADMDTKSAERIAAGTMWESLSQHYSSSIVMLRKCAADLDRVCPLIEKGQKVDLETRNQQTLQSFLERAELAEAEVVRLKALVEALDTRLLDAETNRS